MESKNASNERLERDFAAFAKEANAVLKSCLRLECSEEGVYALSKSSFFAGAEAKRTQTVEDLAAMVVTNIDFIAKLNLTQESSIPSKEFIRFFESVQDGLQAAMRKIALEEMDAKGQ